MGHHGSKYALSTSRMNVVKPAFGPVSFGTKSYGHPTSEALRRVQAAGTKAFVTHRRGTILASSDGTAAR